MVMVFPMVSSSWCIQVQVRSIKCQNHVILYPFGRCGSVWQCLALAGLHLSYYHFGYIQLVNVYPYPYSYQLFQCCSTSWIPFSLPTHLDQLPNLFKAINHVWCFNHTIQLSAKALLKPFSNSLKDDNTIECGNDDEDAGGGVEPIDEGGDEDNDDNDAGEGEGEDEPMDDGEDEDDPFEMLTRLTMSSYWKIQQLCMQH